MGLCLWVTWVLGLASDVDFTAQRLRTYCASCHGLGELRFVFTEDDVETWSYIFQNKSPKSGKLWAEAILTALDWPSDTPPPATETQWMPLGFKRIQLSQDMSEGVSSRRKMVETLRKALSR